MCRWHDSQHMHWESCYLVYSPWQCSAGAWLGEGDLPGQLLAPPLTRPAAHITPRGLSLPLGHAHERLLGKVRVLTVDGVALECRVPTASLGWRAPKSRQCQIDSGTSTTARANSRESAFSFGCLHADSRPITLDGLCWAVAACSHKLHKSVKAVSLLEMSHQEVLMA